MGPAASGRAAGSGLAGLIALLALAMFLNYADRGSLSLAAPVLKDLFRLTNAELGLLLSAFFWSYALMQPLAGALVQRFDVRAVLAVGLALWAGATVLSGFASGFLGLFALRLALGFGESVIYPANARILGTPEAEASRGLANGLLQSAAALGPMAGALAGGLILASLGWRWVFFVLGGVSLLWLGPWLALPRSGALPRGEGARRGGDPGYPQILARRELWGASAAAFCLTYAFYLIVTWLPTFLVKGLHRSVRDMALISGLIFGLQALASAAGGAALDRHVRRGGSRAVAIRALLVVGGLGMSTALLACGFAFQAVAAIAWLLVYGAFSGLALPTLFTAGQTLAGPAAAGRWMGVQNMVSNLAGAVVPVVTGLALDLTGDFRLAFTIASAFALMGVALYRFALPTLAPVVWTAN